MGCNQWTTRSFKRRFTNTVIESTAWMSNYAHKNNGWNNLSMSYPKIHCHKKERPASGVVQGNSEAHSDTFVEI